MEHRSYSRDDRNFEVVEWSVRICFKRVRKSSDLETASKEEAAIKARDIYVSLVTKGWAAMLAELTPQVMPPINPTDGGPIVGEFPKAWSRQIQRNYRLEFPRT